MRIKRPINFKLDAFRAYKNGCSPINAFELASMSNNNIPLSGCMTKKAYASSYMHDDVGNFLRKKIAMHDPEVLAYFEKYGMDTNF